MNSQRHEKQAQVKRKQTKNDAGISKSCLTAFTRKRQWGTSCLCCHSSCSNQHSNSAEHEGNKICLFLVTRQGSRWLPKGCLPSPAWLCPSRWDHFALITYLSYEEQKHSGKLHLAFRANTLFNVTKQCLLPGTETFQSWFCTDNQNSKAIQILFT